MIILLADCLQEGFQEWEIDLLGEIRHLHPHFRAGI